MGVWVVGKQMRSGKEIDEIFSLGFDGNIGYLFAQLFDISCIPDPATICTQELIRSTPDNGINSGLEYCTSTHCTRF
jgi:hypothetical protein